LLQLGDRKSHPLKGKHLSPQTEFKKGQQPHLWRGHKWGVQCPICKKFHGDNPMKGKKRPDLSERNKTLIMREKSRERLLGKVRPQKWCDNISKGKKGKSHIKIRKDGYYGNHNWISKREPNKSESLLINWILENNLPFNYTGNLVNKTLGISPDFTHKTDNSFIEYDCSFFHPHNSIKDKIRNDIYSKNNCQVLILNEKDLDNKENTVKKIEEFTYESANKL
jgi:hypothetical protein